MQPPALSIREIGAGAAFVFYIGAIVWLTTRLQTDTKKRALTFMIVLLGSALGWLFGVLVSPYTTSEGQQFAKYASVISVFASGYLVGKLDRFVSWVLSKDALQKEDAGFRVAAFITAVVTSTLWVYATRAYGR